MSKTWIIFEREYLNLVRKKSFLLSTFLVPLGFAMLFGIQFLSMQVVEKENYLVLIQEQDEGVNTIYEKLAESSSDEITFQLIDVQLDSLKDRMTKQENEAVLILPQELSIQKSNPSLAFTLYSGKNLSEPVVRKIENRVRDAIRTYKIQEAGLTEAKMDEIAFSVKANTIKWTGQDSQTTNVFLASGIGFGVCFFMYMLMGIYGSILMQGVIEEKANRIVEVIVSSVRPFNLLLGKTIAIASVGVTQFLIWMILSGGILFVLAPLMAGQVDPDTLASQPGGMNAAEAESMVQEIMLGIEQFDWTVLWFFPLYFLGGFFLYGSLMASAASAVDNVQDAQQFAFPITILMILPILFVWNIIQNPNSSFAIFSSMFPFFSPMAMLVRMSLTEVPWWQVLLSLTILIASFLACIWVAARIYRTGILMYGKKPSIRELFRWISYK